MIRKSHLKIVQLTQAKRLKLVETVGKTTLTTDWEGKFTKNV